MSAPTIERPQPAEARPVRSPENTIRAAAGAAMYRYDKVAPVVSGPEAVGESEVAFFAENGYLAVANVLTSDELKAAEAALEDILHARVEGAADLVQPEADQKAIWPSLTVEERADRVRKVWLFARIEPRLKAVGDEQPVIQSLLEKLMGARCNMIQDMAMLKPPYVGTEKPWHQDAAYFGWGPPERVLGIWIALDPATAENGCMHVLPGTHREGPVPHAHDRDCQIPDASVQVNRDVIVPLAPGGALFFSALLHHGTPPNSSPSRRRALQYHYAAADAYPIDRRQHAGLFFEGDMYAGCKAKRIPINEIEP